MRSIQVLFTSIIVLFACSCVGQPHMVSIWQRNSDGVPINEIPMYDHVEFTVEQRAANEQFIDGCIDEFGSRDAASDAYVAFGWSYYREGDFRTAMKRFNQAWLLDNGNPDAYWGFGNIAGQKHDFELSIRMLTVAVELYPEDNALLLHDLGKSCNMIAFQFGHEGDAVSMSKNLKIAAGIFEKAIVIDDHLGILYHALAVSRFYLGEPETALENINKAIACGEQVPSEFLDAVERAIKK